MGGIERSQDLPTDGAGDEVGDDGFADGVEPLQEHLEGAALGPADGRGTIDPSSHSHGVRLQVSKLKVSG